MTLVLAYFKLRNILTTYQLLINKSCANYGRIYMEINVSTKQKTNKFRLRNHLILGICLIVIIIIYFEPVLGCTPNWMLFFSPIIEDIFLKSCYSYRISYCNLRFLNITFSEVGQVRRLFHLAIVRYYFFTEHFKFQSIMSVDSYLPRDR